MKTLLICLLLVSSSALATASDKEKAKCPIMKDRMVDIDEAKKKKLYIDYKGKRYYVCCKTCVTLFRRNPEKYADGAGAPIPSNK